MSVALRGDAEAEAQCLLLSPALAAERQQHTAAAAVVTVPCKCCAAMNELPHLLLVWLESPRLHRLSSPLQCRPASHLIRLCCPSPRSRPTPSVFFRRRHRPLNLYILLSSCICPASSLSSDPLPSHVIPLHLELRLYRQPGIVASRPLLSRVIPFLSVAQMSDLHLPSSYESWAVSSPLPKDRLASLQHSPDLTWHSFPALMSQSPHGQPLFEPLTPHSNSPLFPSPRSPLPGCPWQSESTFTDGLFSSPLSVSSTPPTHSASTNADAQPIRRALNYADETHHHAGPADGYHSTSSPATTSSHSSSALSRMMEGVTAMSTQNTSAGGIGLHGCGTSVLSHDQAQRHSSAFSAVRWFTLPQLSQLLVESTRVSEVDRSKWRTTLTPFILLGFHQDYPVVSDESQVSYLVRWGSVQLDSDSQSTQHLQLTLESPFLSSGEGNSFSSDFPQQVANGSDTLQPTARELHLVDVLFDMAHINVPLAGILEHIPIMSDEDLAHYHRVDIELIPNQRHHYGRIGERSHRDCGAGPVQLHVTLLRAKAGSSCAVPPSEPVLFFTAVASDPQPLDARPPPLHPPIVNPLDRTVPRQGYTNEQTHCAASLAAVTFHHLTAVSNHGQTPHWPIATHNTSKADSDVMTVFVTSTDPASTDPASTNSSSTITTPRPSPPVPLVYQYLSNDLNVLSSDSTHNAIREQNIMSVVIAQLTRSACDIASPHGSERIWRTVTGKFNGESTQQQYAEESGAAESSRMKDFIHHFLHSVSSGWEFNRFIKWCLQARKGKGRVDAMCRLCHVMQLHSVDEDAEELRSTHLAIERLLSSPNADDGSMRDERQSLQKKEDEIMKRMCDAISLAFKPSAKDDTKESEGVISSSVVTEDITTPMELLSLVVWLSGRGKERAGTNAANQCLQLLQEQLGIGTDRTSLLDWLADVRTFTLDNSTGQLLMDPNSQWVTSNIHTRSIPFHTPQSGEARRSRLSPPALLITASESTINHNHRVDDSRAIQYHLLQLMDQPQDSPLHSHYLPSLCNFVLSPMLPFVNENAFMKRTGRQFFLPVLIRQSITNPHTPSDSALVTSTSASASSTTSARLRISSQSMLSPHWRCGDAVPISSRLCTLLGSCRPSAGSGIGTAGVQSESEQSSCDMIFLGAVLKVAPQTSCSAAAAEVWALLADSHSSHRFWIHRVDWTSPSSPFSSGLAEDVRESQRRGRSPLSHLLDSSDCADAGQECSFTLPWRSMIQRGWTLVRSWLYPTDDRPVPLPIQQAVELQHSTLPTDIITAALPHSQGYRSRAERLVAGVVKAHTTPTSPISTHERSQRTEEEEEDTEQSRQAPRRSRRSVAGPVTVDKVDAPVSRRKGKEAKERREQVKDTSSKSKGKASRTVRSAAATKSKGEAKKKAEKRKRDEAEKQRIEEERRKEDADNRSKRNEKKRQTAQQSRPSVLKKRKLPPADAPTHPTQPHPSPLPIEVITQAMEATEGVRTRRGVVNRASDVTQPPAGVEGVAADSTKASKRKTKRKRKDDGEVEEEKEGTPTVAPPSTVSSSATVTSQPSSSPHPGPTVTAGPAPIDTFTVSSSPMSQPSPSPQPGSTSIPAVVASTAASSSPAPQPSPSLRLGPAALHSETVTSDSENTSHTIDRIRAAPLWFMYMGGVQKVIMGHKKEVDAWYMGGSFAGPGNAKDSKNLDLMGPVIEVVAEFFFLRQMRGDVPLRPEGATPLDRRRKPRPDLLAQCYVASVGLHDERVQRDYHEVITAHRSLTDSYAMSSRGKRAQHCEVREPWVTYRGITLTNAEGKRLSEAGDCIRDKDTPSYPIGKYGQLDDFRERLRAEFQGRDESPQRPAPKRVRMGPQATSNLDESSHRRPYGRASSPVCSTPEVDQSDSELPLSETAEDGGEEKLAQRVQYLETIIHRLSRSGTALPENGLANKVSRSAISVSTTNNRSPPPSPFPNSSARSSKMCLRKASAAPVAAHSRRSGGHGTSADSVSLTGIPRSCTGPGDESAAVDPAMEHAMPWGLRNQRMPGYSIPSMTAPAGKCPSQCHDMDTAAPSKHSMTSSHLPHLIPGPSYPVYHPNPPMSSFCYQGPYIQTPAMVSHLASSFSQHPQLHFAAQPSPSLPAQSQLGIVQMY